MRLQNEEDSLLDMQKFDNMNNIFENKGRAWTEELKG